MVAAAVRALQRTGRSGVRRSAPQRPAGRGQWRASES